MFCPECCNLCDNMKKHLKHLYTLDLVYSKGKHKGESSNKTNLSVFDFQFSIFMNKF